MRLRQTVSRPIKRLISSVLGAELEPAEKRQPLRRQIFSIGMYAGSSPLELYPAEIPNPVLTGESVTDAKARFVADPFMLKMDGTWCMFFEVLNLQSGKGEIGLATSPDALHWGYQRIVLREPFHLSYPYVFRWNDACYMIPESFESKSVRLYHSVDFPTRWSLVRTLLEGDDFVDPSIFYFNARWWLLADLARPPYFAGTLRLFHADELDGPWAEHPRSPIVEGNPHIARPGGRVLVADGKVIRFTQDCCPEYGIRVQAFEIKELSVTRYHEQAIDLQPKLEASGTGWNASGMHHVDPHRTEDGRWIACVDGFFWTELT